MKLLRIWGRASYFQVKDAARFQSWLHDALKESDLTVWEDTDPEVGTLFTFSYQLTIEQGMNEDTPLSLEELAALAAGEEPPGAELDGVFYASTWLEQLAAHLAPNWVAVVNEACVLFDPDLKSIENVSGGTAAINAQGEVVLLSTEDLYSEPVDETGKPTEEPSMVKMLGRFVTRPIG